ncbi:MAG: hypothetical protein H0T46_32115 [Deltaproteobacteria bacterium]|nr:hypothetical protein [Deltaproteobacteria bacterium]
MRHASLLALSLAALVTGCLSDDSPDGIDDQGFGTGKADGEELTACEKDAIITYLNEGHSAEKLEEAGVHTRAAASLVKHRDGADGLFGTEDDNKFDSAEEVDAVSYVGPRAIAALREATGERCAADVYEQARDVTKAHITFAEGAPAPTSYDYPDGNGFNLSGTEFWQKWSGGKNPTYSFTDGTDAGRRCMQAAAIRFETIMKDPPAELVKLNADTNWGGSFFNWNDDFSGPNAFGDGSGARLWAWRTSLIKWISQTKKDGSCLLPTRDMVVNAAKACLETGTANAGEIQGCQVR